MEKICQYYIYDLQPDLERHDPQMQNHLPVTEVHNSGFYSIWYNLIGVRRAAIQQYVSGHYGL
jgi:hypothetical protein